MGVEEALSGRAPSPPWLRLAGVRRYSDAVRLRWLLIYPVMTLATLVVTSSVIVAAMLGLHRITYPLTRAWSRLLLLVCGVRLRVCGLEHVPRDGSYVIVSNHASHFDGPALAVALPHPAYFVVKRELTRIPMFGPAIVRLGLLPVDRRDRERSHQQMAAAAEVVRAGRRVLVFAEGTRSPSDEMLPFKKGGFHLAVDAQVPILPVAVNGSRRLLAKGEWRSRSGVLEVVVGEPIATDGMGKESVNELLERTRSSIEAMRAPARP